jgi:hypothetical protein
MPASYLCDHPARLQRLRALVEAADPAAVNAIDHLVVVDGDAVPDSLRQRLLLVSLLSQDGVGGLAAQNVAVTGGVRVRDPRVQWAVRLSDLDPTLVRPVPTPEEAAFLNGVKAQHAGVEGQFWLAVLLERYGDHSTYRLLLRDGAQAPAGFDPVLSEIAFSFKVECPSPFDCADGETHAAPPPDEPDLDYLSRDFASFRRLMVDRLALLAPADPEATNTDPAELRTTLVEVLAYAADQAAYFQDAVATEAYLGTARTRPSVRRHARLLDYPMHEGCNARAYVQLRLAEGTGPISGAALRPGATLLTRVPDRAATVPLTALTDALTYGPQAFEVLAGPATFAIAHHEIAVHTWADADCCLPAGATSVWVVDDGGLRLARGDALLLQQTRSPDTLLPQDADPALRHVVRITDVGPQVTDPLLTGARVRELTWHDEDALPFPLQLTVDTSPVAAAAANLVLADHGLPVSGERLTITPWGRGLRATLSRTDLTWACRPPAADASATAALRQDPAAALPAVRLAGEGETWTAVPDLIGATSSARGFVVEPESDRTIRVRFGDDVLGRRPRDLTGFTADYRVGSGTGGNVGADAIAHLVADPATVNSALSSALDGVANPLPAAGGVPPERLDEVRRYAPVAFTVQQRAVTEADWVEAAQRHPDVQRAVAVRRWTGSWHTVYVTVDPVSGRDFERIRPGLVTWLEPFRLAGYDLEVVAPSYVPLDIVLAVRVAAGSFPEDVQRELARQFSTRELPDGRLGFFHPDRFSFGDSVWLSQVVARAMAVPGVTAVDTVPSAPGERPVSRFTRWGAVQGTEFDDGRIAVGDLEIARCDSDPSTPDHGRIAFDLRSGS